MLIDPQQLLLLVENGHGLQPDFLELALEANPHLVARGKIQLAHAVQAIRNAVQAGAERRLADKTGAIQIVVEAHAANGQAILQQQNLLGRSQPETYIALLAHQRHHRLPGGGGDHDLVIGNGIHLLASQLQGLRPLHGGLEGVQARRHQRVAGTE
ncbi:hypothetical protein D9M69_576740 [compost metagenome]